MRYDRNMNMLSLEENERLKTFTVLIVGCGGLGGYVIEMLSRLGIGRLICFDYDCFDESNLNRQLLSTEKNLGTSKADAAKKRVELINSDIVVEAYHNKANEETLKDLIKDCDVIIDAVDDVQAKLMLERLANEHDMILIHGAIAGWYGQVSTVYPSDFTLKRLYQHAKIGIEKELGNPSFTPATIASLQVAECLKVLLKKDNNLRNKVLMIDLLNHDYEVIDF